MVTISRSESLWGPFKSNPSNPILTNTNTTSLCKSNPSPTGRHGAPFTDGLSVQAVGHADLFQDKAGNW